MSVLGYVHKTKREKCIKAHLTTTSIAIFKRRSVTKYFWCWCPCCWFFFGHT